MRERVQLRANTDWPWRNRWAREVRPTARPPCWSWPPSLVHWSAHCSELYSKTPLNTQTRVTQLSACFDGGEAEEKVVNQKENMALQQGPEIPPLKLLKYGFNKGRYGSFR